MERIYRQFVNNHLLLFTCMLCFIFSFFWLPTLFWSFWYKKLKVIQSKMRENDFQQIDGKCALSHRVLPAHENGSCHPRRKEQLIWWGLPNRRRHWLFCLSEKIIVARCFPLYIVIKSSRSFGALEIPPKRKKTRYRREYWRSGPRVYLGCEGTEKSFFILWQ